MPAFATDYLGAANIGPIYGLMLTGWGLGSVPRLLLTVYIRQSTGTRQGHATHRLVEDHPGRRAE